MMMDLNTIGGSRTNVDSNKEKESNPNQTQTSKWDKRQTDKQHSLYLPTAENEDPNEEQQGFELLYCNQL